MTVRSALTGILVSCVAAACTGQIGDALNGGAAPSCGPAQSCDAGQGGQTTPQGSSCPATADVGASQLQRLSKTQYMNALTDIFGSSVVSQLGPALSQIPDDDTVVDPDALTRVSSDQVTGYMAVAWSLAQAVTSSTATASAVFGSCVADAHPSANCVDGYLKTTAPRIFRRPLTQDEITAAEGMVTSGTGSYLDNLADLLSYHLQTPWFTTRVELGAGAPDAAQTFTLTPFEVATRIAFATTNSTPDSTLFDAAAANQLSTRAQIEEHVRRLFATPRGKARVRAILYNYAGNPTPSDLTVLPPQLLSGLNNPAGLSTSMFAEMDQFIDYIVWEKKGSLSDLLTSQASFATDPDLASIYGHAPADPNRAPGSPTAMFSGRRAGIMMRLPLLASAGPRTRLPRRGVTILRNLFCAAIPDPDAQTMAMIAQLTPPPDQLEKMTNRQFMETVTAQGACHACHQFINPIGFAFENLGPEGRLRREEAIFTTNTQSGTFVSDLPINTVTDVKIDGTTSTAQDALDLVNDFVKSKTAPDCFSRRAYRFVQQRLEAENDACTLGDMSGQLAKSNGSILDALVVAVANDATTLHRKPQ